MAIANASPFCQVSRSRKNRGAVTMTRMGAVVDDRTQADPDLVVSLKDEHPIRPHGHAGERQKGAVPFVLPRGELVPGGEVEHRQEGEAQQGAQQDDLLAGQVDAAGGYAVGAE